MDRLREMFELQRALQSRLGTPLVGNEIRNAGRDFSTADESERETLTKWHKEFTLALMMEASELMDWSAWKHWSKRLGNKSDAVTPFTNEHRAEILLEVVDCFHFLINIALLYGVDPDEIYNVFLSKNAVNHQRQDGGKY